jgi:CBS domain-containing protein
MLKLGDGKSLRISEWLKEDATVLYISSKAPVSCTMDQQLREVIPVVSEKYRRLPVLDKNGHVRGVLSATDVLRLLSGMWKKRYRTRTLIDLKVRGIMSPHLIEIDKNMKVREVLDFFKQHRKGAYPVVYRKSLVGVVSEWDIVRQIRERTGIKVSDIMVRKPLVAQDRHSVADVAKMMSMGGFRRLPVVKNGILVGIMTPRDVLSFLRKGRLLNRLQGQKQEITRIMRSDVVTAAPGMDIFEAVKLMVSMKIGGLPVVEDHHLVGIVTERDIVDVVEF